eukprot:TRINITY_DN302_c0_g4_i1.p1 TRINITY_DN302_c0_g4~~TRINITY_DN302_c0_g4_i1.p1  ORF type:complete len:564 (+),score=241.80 TRINITY_DN302_c0_g4_i1:22-1713(+)
MSNNNNENNNNIEINEKIGKSEHLLHLSVFNKDTAFTENERKSLKLRGLIPPAIETLEQQCSRALSQLRGFETMIEKYIYLSSLQDRNQTLFYSLLMNNLVETLPIVYTPTVGEACVKFAHNWRVAQGMYFASEDKGSIRSMLDNWPREQVDIIVVTDGSRILGLGDLGANGMGIPIGKLSLYVAGAGFNPARTLPCLLDFGTNREELLNDPEYLGMKHNRVTGEEYYSLVEEFVEAVYDKWPNVLVQFEDFSNDHAFDLLDIYRNKHLCFNDDIQGTGAVILSGYINCLKLQNIDPKDAKLVFIGAGSAGVGVADTIVSWFETQGISTEEARSKFYFVDSRGLVTADRGDKLASHKVRYARTDNDGKQAKDLLDIIKLVKPNGLIGLSGQSRIFHEDHIKEMCSFIDNPVIMALSNPTSKAECTAEQAYTWSEGKAIFCSGSPFDPVEINGKTIVPGQGNNMYIFPGLGFGAYLCKAKTITEPMIVAAAESLANSVNQDQLDSGCVYPKLDGIRDISSNVAVAVIKKAREQNLTTLDIPDDELKEWIISKSYKPCYTEYSHI